MVCDGRVISGLIKNRNSFFSTFSIGFCQTLWLKILPSCACRMVDTNSCGKFDLSFILMKGIKFDCNVTKVLHPINKRSSQYIEMTFLFYLNNASNYLTSCSNFFSTTFQSSTFQNSSTYSALLFWYFK